MEEKTIFENVEIEKQESVNVPYDLAKVQEIQPPAKQEPASVSQPVKLNQADYKENLQSAIVSQILQNKIGTITLTKEQETILFEDFSDDEVLIRPDGLIYLSWSWYAERLRRAFGLSWQIVPADAPKTTKTNEGKPCVVWAFYLFVNGVYLAYAIGEHIEERLKQLSFGEACESAKSNALMRLCKNIGMSLKLWNRDYAKNWVKVYAKQMPNKSGRLEWVKLSDKELAEKRRNFLKAAHALGVPENKKIEILKKNGIPSGSLADVGFLEMEKIYFALQAVASKKQAKKEDKQEEKQEEDTNQNEY